MKKSLKIRGTFNLKVFEGDVLVKEYSKKNLVVDGGLNVITGLLGGGTSYTIANIGFGTGGAAPDPSDIALISQFVKAVTTVTYPLTGQVRFDWELLSTEYNGNTIQQYGLFTNAPTPALFSSILDTPIVKTAANRLEGFWIIEISNN